MNTCMPTYLRTYKHTNTQDMFAQTFMSKYIFPPPTTTSSLVSSRIWS